MRWLADENLHRAIVRELRGSGHDVLYAAEDSRQARDSALLRLAAAESRVVLTEDKDFGELVFRNRQPSAGIVLLRMRPQSWEVKWMRVSTAIATYGETLALRFTVVEPSDIRSQLLKPDDKGPQFR